MSVFEVILVRIFPYSDWTWRDTEYSVRVRENTDQNNSEYGHFLRSDIQMKIINFRKKKVEKSNGPLSEYIEKYQKWNGRIGKKGKKVGFFIFLHT